MKAKGAGLLRDIRAALHSHVGPDTMMKFRAWLGQEENLKKVFGIEMDPMRQKVDKAVDSYRKLIEAAAPKWRGVSPDFCKPLLDALDGIETSAAAF